MGRRPPILLGLVIFAGLTLPAFALDWTATTIAVATAPLQSTQGAVFEFVNKGAKAVTILDLQTSCDCLAAVSDKKTYSPGETGVVRATFTVGDRIGLYERTIAVLTDEAASPVRLLLRIEVPAVALVTPQSVTWKINEPAEAKSVDLTPATGLTIIFAEAQSTNSAFTARLETVEAGRHYRLHLKPSDTAQPASVAIRIFGREKSGQEIVVSAYASVQ